MEADQQHPVSILLSPGAVKVIDLFRAFGLRDEVCSVDVVDKLEGVLSQAIGVDAAKTLASDVLLFSFALKRRSSVALEFRPISSRFGTRDEYCLLTLISNASDPDNTLAHEAATELDILEQSPLMSLAGDISTSLGAMPFKTSFVDASVFRKVVGASPRISDDGLNHSDPAYVKFNFTL